MSNSDNDEWLRRFRLNAMQLVEQRIAAAKDNPNDKNVDQLPGMRETLQHFERKLNDPKNK